MESNGSEPLKLARAYTLWYSGFAPIEDDDSGKKKYVTEPIADVETVEEFWAVYQYVVKPSEASPKTSYHLFQKGVKPVWEDEFNSNGGRWLVWIPRSSSDKLWEDVMLFLLGNQTQDGDQIAGVEIKLKSKNASISMWHKDREDQDQIRSTKADLYNALGDTDHALKLDYHKFETSKKNKFRRGGDDED